MAWIWWYSAASLELQHDNNKSQQPEEELQIATGEPFQAFEPMEGKEVLFGCLQDTVYEESLLKLLSSSSNGDSFGNSTGK